MKELYEKVASDSILQAKFLETMKDAEKVGADGIINKMVSFAREAGFEVTPIEVQAFFKNLSTQQNPELSDAELDAVAGGKVQNGVLISIFSVGLACAVLSASTEISGYGCKNFLEVEIE